MPQGQIWTQLVICISWDEHPASCHVIDCLATMYIKTYSVKHRWFFWDTGYTGVLCRNIVDVSAYLLIRFKIYI